MPNKNPLQESLDSITLALAVYDAAVDGTESFEEGHVGADLAYLMAAILRGSMVEFYTDRQLVEVLRKAFPEGHRVWKFITVPLSDTARQAVADALGYDVDDERIRQGIDRFADKDTPTLRKHLTTLQRRFKVAGGRGVELADEIDDASIALAVRKQ